MTRQEAAAKVWASAQLLGYTRVSASEETVIEHGQPNERMYIHVADRSWRASFAVNGDTYEAAAAEAIAEMTKQFENRKAELRAELERMESGNG